MKSTLKGTAGLLTTYYLPLRARAEAPRMILAFGKVPHENVDVSFTDWAALKSAGDICPFGRLPSLKLANGAVIAQSGAITRYTAKLANVYPTDPAVAAQADMIFELAQDMQIINLVTNFYPKGSADWQKGHDSHFAAFPKRMDAAQKILGKREFFGGSSPTFGDFGLFHIVDISLLVQPSCLASHPNMSAWVNRMAALPDIDKYLKDRPGPSTQGWGRPGSFIMSM